MAKKIKKSKIPRNKEKYATFNVKRQVSNRRELLEADYIHKLNDAEKDWLNRFNEEYVIANFNHKGKLIDGSKKARKKSYDANNARNRCQYTKAKTTGLMNNTPTEAYLKSYIDQNVGEIYETMEEALLDSIDKSNAKKLGKKLK